jgi:hypothetical protein
MPRDAEELGEERAVHPLHEAIGARRAHALMCNAHMPSMPREESVGTEFRAALLLRRQTFESDEDDRYSSLRGWLLENVELD